MTVLNVRVEGEPSTIRIVSVEVDVDPTPDVYLDDHKRFSANRYVMNVTINRAVGQSRASFVQARRVFNTGPMGYVSALETLTDRLDNDWRYDAWFMVAEKAAIEAAEAAVA